MSDWLSVIKKIAPRAKAEIAEGLAAAMPDIIENYDVDTKLRQAHFLAQCAHESAGFTTTVEFASGVAYSHRKDLGFVGKYAGKGPSYKGFGLIQTTGPTNQRKVAVALGIEAEWQKNPRVLAAFPYAALSAGYYWKDRGLNRFADRDDVVTVTRRVNGGLNGLADRKTYLSRAKAALAGDEVTTESHGVVLPRAKVKALQEALGGFYPLGVPDGIVGRNTVKSISAFQHDNGLPISGAFDEATVEAIEAGVNPPAVSDDVANGKPDDSRILKGAGRLKMTAAGLMAPAAASLADDPLGALEKASGFKSRIDALLEPFGGLGDLLGHHWPVLVLAAGITVFVFAHHVSTARIEEYRSGKTP